MQIPIELANAAPFRTNGIRMIYAGFWKRFAAAWIDYLVIYTIMSIWGVVYAIYVIFPIIAEYEGAYDYVDANVDALILGTVTWLAIAWIYFAVFESSKKQATLGKLAVGIKVTDLHGNRIGFGKASGRYFSKFISATIIGIGYLMAAFTKRKQGLHDMMAGCLVISRDADPDSVSAER